VVDRVEKYEVPSTVEARFFGYNYDGQGSQHARTDGFITVRPGAIMRAHVMSNKAVTIEAGHLPIPEEQAVKHPYASVITEPDTDITLVTVLAISRPDQPTAPVSIAGGGGRGQVQVGGRTVSIDDRSVSVK
jgi:hypothetical protein